MQTITRRIFTTILTISMLFTVSACSTLTIANTDSSKTQSFGSGDTSIRIASGSENREVEQAIKQAAEQAHVKVTLDYMGSLDIMSTLANKGARNGVSYDAVWPASSMWISMGDMHHMVKDTVSTSVTPIVFGIRKSTAVHLGWTDSNGVSKPVSTQDILAKVQSGELKFSMTSATQSNSGASAYLAFLNALSGSSNPISEQTLQDTTVTDRVKKILAGVDRSSGSSDWLKDMIVNQPDRFDAMVNYESLIIQANRQLTKNNHEPLIAIYPSDGIALSDSPLGYVDHGQDSRIHDGFIAFQQQLTSKQSKLLFEQAGRRTGLGGVLANPNDSQVKTVFNPAWGIRTDTATLKTITMPAANVVRAALDLYQTQLRKPSWTVWIVDYSGSMSGDGKNGVVDGMRAALQPDLAKQAGISPTDKDVNVFIPFDSNARNVTQSAGKNTNHLLDRVTSEEANGGTNIYAGLEVALSHLPSQADRVKYTTAIALLTDGQSDTWDKSQTLKDYESKAEGVPIFPIMFGDADPDQLNDLAKISNGKTFDGRSDDLATVFRTVKGYN